MKMKISSLNLLMLSIFMLSCGSAPQKSYELFWADEFDYSGLPDSIYWGYEEGFVRNNEAQYYTKERLENVEVKDGMLHITAIKEEFEGADYTSGSITTRDKFDFTYGRVEALAKMPRGFGTWAAIWMIGSNITDVPWPACGEIDILEYVGHDPEILHFNAHCKKYNHKAIPKVKTGIEYPTTDKPSDEFHLYAVEWYEDRIEWHYDDKLVHTFFRKDGDGVEGWPFFEPQFLILNLAIGGNWGAQRGIDDSIFPQEMTVDYVRVYRIVEE